MPGGFFHDPLLKASTEDRKAGKPSKFRQAPLRDEILRPTNSLAFHSGGGGLYNFKPGFLSRGRMAFARLWFA